MTTPEATLVPRGRLLWIAVLAPLAATILLSFARTTISAATSVLVLVLVIVAVSTAGDRVAGLIAAASSGLCFDFLLTEPYNKLTIDDPDNVEATVLLVLIGIAVTEIAVQGRRAATRASRQHGYLEGVLQATATIRDSALPRDEVLTQIARQIADVLNSSCRVAYGSVKDSRLARLESTGDVTYGGVILDIDRNGLPATQEIAIIPGDSTTATGYFVVSSGDHIAHPSLERRKVASLLASQAANSLAAKPAS